MIDVRVSHGMILGSNHEKMSKSKGNVINPDTVVNEVGADALRVYEMFIGDYQQDVSWSTDSLRGCKRFLDRIYKLGEKLSDKEGYTNETLVHQTIKKVTDDLSNLKFNTAVSQLMILTNDLDKNETITKNDYKILLTLLNPIAPHITEELNEKYALGKPICESSWPTFDEEKTKESTVNIAVQVNGKLRGTMNVPSNTDKEETLRLAKELDNVKKHLENTTILKEIVVPNKIVNIVTKQS